MRSVLLSLLFFILLSPPARAAFFLRRPATASALLERQGGLRVQQSAIVLNGAEGTLSVYAFDLAVADLEEKVRAMDANARAGIFLLPCGAPEAPQCLAFALETDAPVSGPPEWPWSDLPPVGGLEPSFSALINDGRTGFAGGDSALSADAARAAWTSHLASLGWLPASPAADSTSLSLHVKGRETLALTVLALPDGSSRVSLLRRAPRSDQTP